MYVYIKNDTCVYQYITITDSGSIISLNSYFFYHIELNIYSLIEALRSLGSF
jgi:hypothetical protein